MIISFTGTHIRITDVQKEKLAKVLDLCQPTEIHHGCCICADEYVHGLAVKMLPNCKIVIHPPINQKAIFLPADDERISFMVAKEYLKRNHDIVDAGDLLIALPYEDKEQVRSGVWATIRYARKTGKRYIIIDPSGTIIDG